MKKTFILGFISASIFATSAGASTFNCTIKEGGSQTRVTEVQHHIDGNTHGMTQFETAYTTGFVAVSRGYGVINFVGKEDGRSFSFYGDILHGRKIGGNFYMADGNSWVQVECN